MGSAIDPRWTFATSDHPYSETIQRVSQHYHIVYPNKDFLPNAQGLGDTKTSGKHKVPLRRILVQLMAQIVQEICEESTVLTDSAPTTQVIEELVNEGDDGKPRLCVGWAIHIYLHDPRFDLGVTLVKILKMNATELQKRLQAKAKQHSKGPSAVGGPMLNDEEQYKMITDEIGWVKGPAACYREDVEILASGESVESIMSHSHPASPVRLFSLENALLRAKTAGACADQCSIDQYRQKLSGPAPVRFIEVPKKRKKDEPQMNQAEMYQRDRDEMDRVREERDRHRQRPDLEGSQAEEDSASYSAASREGTPEPQAKGKGKGKGKANKGPVIQEYRLLNEDYKFPFCDRVWKIRASEFTPLSLTHKYFPCVSKIIGSDDMDTGETYQDDMIAQHIELQTGVSVQNMTAEKAMGRIEQLEQKDMLRQMERENSEMITRIQALYDAGSMEEFQEQYAQFKEGAKDRLHAALSPTETRLSDSLRGMLSFYNHYPEKQVFMRTTSSDPTLSIFANMVARRMMELEREYKVATLHLEAFILYLSRLDAFRFSDGLHFNVLATGAAATGKSFLFQLMSALSHPDTIAPMAHATAKADAGYRNNDDVNSVWEEMSAAMLGIEKGQQQETGDPLFKAKLTNPVIGTKYFTMDDRTGMRTSATCYSSHMGTLQVATNENVDKAPKAIQSRFLYMPCAERYREGHNAMDLDHVVGKPLSATADKAPGTSAREGLRSAYWFEQFLVALVEKHIMTHVFPDVNMDVFILIARRVLDELHLRGVKTDRNRDYERLYFAARTLTILFAIECLFNCETAPYRSVDRFEMSQLMDITPYMVCTEEIAYFAITLLEMQYINPNESTVLDVMGRCMGLYGTSDAKYKTLNNGKGLDYSYLKIDFPWSLAANTVLISMQNSIVRPSGPDIQKVLTDLYNRMIKGTPLDQYGKPSKCFEGGRFTNEIEVPRMMRIIEVDEINNVFYLNVEAIPNWRDKNQPPITTRTAATANTTTHDFMIEAIKASCHHHTRPRDILLARVHRCFPYILTRIKLEPRAKEYLCYIDPNRCTEAERLVMGLPPIPPEDTERLARRRIYNMDVERATFLDHFLRTAVPFEIGRYCIPEWNDAMVEAKLKKEQRKVISYPQTVIEQVEAHEKMRAGGTVSAMVVENPSELNAIGNFCVLTKFARSMPKVPDINELLDIQVQRAADSMPLGARRASGLQLPMGFPMSRDGSRVASHANSRAGSRRPSASPAPSPKASSTRTDSKDNRSSRTHSPAASSKSSRRSTPTHSSGSGKKRRHESGSASGHDSDAHSVSSKLRRTHVSDHHRSRSPSHVSHRSHKSTTANIEYDNQ